MVLLLLLISTDPHFSCFFFAVKDFIQILNRLIELLLGQFSLAFDTLNLDLQSLFVPGQIDDLLVQLFDLLAPLGKSLLFNLDDILKTTALLDLLAELDFVLMPYFIGDMQLLCGVLKILGVVVALLKKLSVIDLQGTVLNLELFEVVADLIEFLLETGYSDLFFLY